MILAGMIAALGVLFVAGLGITLLLVRETRPVNLLEAIALSWLFGSGLVSILLWAGGLLFSGALLQGVTAAIALAIGAGGLWTAQKAGLRLSLPRPRSASEWALSAIVMVEIGAVFYFSFGQGLNWDGLLNWEVKARYGFENGGVVPAAYYTSGTRIFTHPAYPLLIPLTELWLYLGMGEAHQFWVKIIFPLYYLAAAILLGTTVHRLTNRRWPGLLTATLFFFIPCLIGSPGGATGGYVDVPLSVLYLATMAYLLIQTMDDDPRAWRIAACCLALLPWAKREGKILWAVAAFCGLLVVWQKRRWSSLLWLVPGLVLMVSWQIFLFAMKTVEAREFVPMTPATLWENLPRVFPIFQLIGSEMLTLTRWSLFWPIALLAFVSLAFRARDRRLLLLFMAVATPLLAYGGTYLFSSWPDFSEHLGSSFPRLLLHVMPVAWLAVALAMVRPLPQASKLRD